MNQVVKEVKDTHESMKELLGNDFKTAVWRYPGGHMSWKGTKEADDILKQAGYEWMDWNAMSGDAEPISTRPTLPWETLQFHEQTLHIAENDHVRVVLMHDAFDKEITVDSLPYLIEYYQSHGFEFGVLE